LDEDEFALLANKTGATPPDISARSLMCRDPGTSRLGGEAGAKAD
jgi:hypothetical protein